MLCCIVFGNTLCSQIHLQETMTNNVIVNLILEGQNSDTFNSEVLRTQ